MYSKLYKYFVTVLKNIYNNAQVLYILNSKLENK